MSSAEKIYCDVCPHECMLTEGHTGICGVRTYREGRKVSVNYGQSTALALDPIEKKPLAQFYPGSMILSYGSYGCNLRCQFCQNAEISMIANPARICTRDISPDTLVETAKELVSVGNIGIAYTYNEPLIAWEYLRDAAHLARQVDLKNAVITNGYVSDVVWHSLLPLIDACNIDLKCFSNVGYEKLGAPGGLDVVQRAIRAAVTHGIHVEVTTLVVPGFSDDESLFEAECQWLASLNEDIPLHITRFFPSHHLLDRSSTEISLLRHFEQIAQGFLSNVYVGNI